MCFIPAVKGFKFKANNHWTDKTVHRAAIFILSNLLNFFRKSHAESNTVPLSWKIETKHNSGL